MFRLAAEVALTHHERYDGTGYPSGLAGGAIPLSGRITAIVDFYDALTMDRVYRPAMTASMALNMPVEQRGKAFDPVIVDTFVLHSEMLDGLRCRISQLRPSFADLIDAP